MDGQSRLLEIARQIREGQRPRGTTVKGLLKWFEASRRRGRVPNQIAATMNQLGIRTEPDFLATPSIDDKITFLAATPTLAEAPSKVSPNAFESQTEIAPPTLSPIPDSAYDSELPVEAGNIGTLANEAEEDGDSVSGEPDERPVICKSLDWPVAVLADLHNRGRLRLQPGFQREYVWEKMPKLRSRLIESLLLDIPIPPIYLGTERGGRFEVIDGQQRLTTLIRFVRNEFPLESLAGMSSLNGRYYKDLREEEQSKIDSSTIHTVQIDAGKRTNLRYEIFERLNRGAVPLKEQEIRNCIFRGTFCDLLKQLEASDQWRKTKGTDKPDPRFIEREYILRFFALAERIEHYTGKLKQFLTDSMEMLSKSCESAPTRVDELRGMFLQTVQNVCTVFGSKAGRVYRRVNSQQPDGRWEDKFSVAAFDIQASALLAQPTPKVQVAQEQIEAAYIQFLLANPKVMEAISGQGTTKREPTRLRWFGFKPVVDEILGGTVTEPRFFPYELRKELFEKSDTCQLCRNQIYSFDDCTVDHVRAYSRGGKTVRDNAQLAHRYCNALKSASVDSQH